MIEKMIGNINGHELIFIRDSGEWIATVPSHLSGEYVISISAYDEAGNNTYATDMVFLVDSSNISITVIPFKYISETSSKYSSVVVDEYYKCEMVVSI